MSESPAFPVRPRSVEAMVPGTAAVLVWSRALVVFAGLLLFKLILIAGQGESLYETHWRIGAVRMNVLNYFAFYGFVLIGVLSLFRLGKDCRTTDVKTLRSTNAVVIGLGLSFIFLTFHNGNKNFLYPVLSGVLTGSSLGPYVANVLFFNQPFLGGWLFAYAAIYYVLVRTNRERWVMRLTAIFAGAYAVLYLQEFMVQRTELLILDGLGVISLAMARRSATVVGATGGVRLGGAWLLVPLAWTVFFGGALLRFDNQWHSNPATYFLSLLGLTLALFLLASLVVRMLGNPQAWSWLVPFFFVAFFILANRNYPSSSNYSHLLCLALTFPRYFAGDLALVGCLVVAAFVFRRYRPASAARWLDVVGLLLLVIAAIDLRLCQIMGVRLGWDVLAFGDSPKMMFKMAKPYLPAVVAGLLVASVIFALILRAVRTWAVRRSAGNPGCKASPSISTEHSQAVNRGGLLGRPASFEGARYIGALFVVFAVLGVSIAESDKLVSQPVLHLVQTSPLWKRVASRPMSREEFLRAASLLGFGDFSRASSRVAGPAPRDLNVVVVFMESSYNKHLSLFGGEDDTQPLLSKYKDRMELFPNFFSAFTGSIHARFATFSSLYPVKDFETFTQERVPVKTLFEVFHDRGYSCSMFYSSFFDYTGFRDFLKNRGLDEMYDADSMPGTRSTQRVEWGLLEEETLGAIRTRLKKYAHDNHRFCLTYVPAAPHYPYDHIPKQFQKNKLTTMDDFKPRYLNELLYMDWVLASIIDELRETGLLDHTLVVITNDHGEMLGGKDERIGHGWVVTPALANTPLILMDPGRSRFEVNKTVGTQVDLLPTILDRLNIPLPPGQLYQGKSLDADRQGGFGFLNSYKQFAILSGDEILLGDRDSSTSAGDVPAGANYRITNEGCKTLFTLDEQSSSLPNRQELMRRFDTFQESFLRNYSFYCESLKTAGTQQAKQTQRPGK